ncbi:hypothetical protein CEXT_255651 [Caerostris extrusa]|uniref:Uncharacterized protein n=1 Tax=Caerostris extrusa TaxID=172846 RepID=A0AAV4QJM1_CAEEX|nr:hypothetical protein CEXT_255651 [Caerostris extrusa]
MVQENSYHYTAAFCITHHSQERPSPYIICDVIAPEFIGSLTRERFPRFAGSCNESKTNLAHRDCPDFSQGFIDEIRNWYGVVADINGQTACSKLNPFWNLRMDWSA